MKRLLPLLLLPLFLTSCSNPDTSGGVTLSRDVGDGHPGHWPFPDGSCSDQHDYSATNTGCGWVHLNEDRYYIMPHADLSYANLSNAHLTGADLSYADLSNASAIGVDLSGANLIHATLNISTLYNAHLSGANLEFSTLYNAHLRNVDLNGAHLSNAHLAGSTSLVYVDLRGADLRNADLTGADLSEVNLSGANLSGARMVATSFHGVNLRGADLSGASGLDSIIWYVSDVQLDSSTICPNGIHWGTAGNDCNKD